jgi:hypothetical protein
MELTAQVCTGWLIVADVLARYGMVDVNDQICFILTTTKTSPDLRFICLSYVL